MSGLPLLMAMLMSNSAFGATQVHECIDKNGKAIYSNNPCSSGQATNTVPFESTQLPQEVKSKSIQISAIATATNSAQVVAAFCKANRTDRDRLRDELIQQGPLAAEELVALLRDSESSECWERAADVLHAIGRRAKGTLPELLEMLRASRDIRRAYIVSALKGIGKGDASVEYALIELLTTGDPFSKGLAAKALGDMKANRATEALATVLSDGSAMASEMAASALREIGPPAEAAVPALVAAARKNKDAYLAKLCVQALTAIGTPQAKEAIRQLEAGK